MSKYINRTIESHLIEIKDAFPVIMITGPRQVGKSTLLNHIANDLGMDIKSVTLDNVQDRTLAKEDPELFLETYSPPVIIDEFQYAPELLSYIKMAVDNKRYEALSSGESANGMFFLTCSQRFLSMSQISESLAGRVGIVDLYGLSNKEINGERQNIFIPDITLLKNEEVSHDSATTKKIFERIFRGSYPELYKNSKIPREIVFDSYIKTYIEKDIRKLINIKDEVKFMKFMVSVAARSSQELNLNELSNDADISNPTANNWLSILSNTGLIFLLQPYSKNIIKRVVKRPKIYFMDTGLASYLTKHPSSEILENSYYAGAIFETYVVSEIIKSFTNKGLNPERYLYYYRDNNKNEIDVVMEYKNKLYPIEIKKSKQPNKSAVKNFFVLQDTKMEIANGTVLCMIDKIFPIDRDNYYVPIRYI
jgi:predicted AAA+ superfamily ATPase